MKCIQPILCALVSAAIMAAQANTARQTVTGTVMDPEGAPFAGAFVQLKNSATAGVLNAVSDPRGKYTLGVPAPGLYGLSVNVPGMKPYAKPDIQIRAGETLQIDARLEDSLQLRTLGEDPETIFALFINRPPPPSGPAPRTPDGKPDLSGVWLGAPAEIPKLDMLPWAADLTEERTANNAKDHPLSRCLPAFPVALLGPGFFRLVQSPAMLVMILDDDVPGFRQVFLDGRPHPKDFGPSWLGHATGKWDGDTLVLDLVGFQDKGWIDFSGHPNSEALHIIERIRRPDLGHLEIEIAVDDPGAYRKPWSTKKTASLAPGEEILEFICNENNKDVAHMVGK
ncbi:MAG TPA: carboxypeptidase-like regulatory domain-containing protein [Bryobacteraceae bacterium]